MVADTFANKRLNKVEAGGSDEGYIYDYFEAGDGNLKPGAAYKVATGARVATICGAAEMPDGVVVHRDGFQLDGSTKRHLDLAYTQADKNVKVCRFCRNQGRMFWMFLAASQACDITSRYTSAANGTMTKWAYTDAAEATDCLSMASLKGAEYFAADYSYIKLRRFVVSHG